MKSLPSPQAAGTAHGHCDHHRGSLTLAHPCQQELTVRRYVAPSSKRGSKLFDGGLSPLAGSILCTCVQTYGQRGKYPLQGR